MSEIGWREFSYHLLDQFPKLPEQAFRSNFKKFPWKKNAKHLKAWQQGKTGFPIVDAGMRELWATGWMHNRVRMIVGSFLVKDLLIPWQQGAAWFWDTLVDADLAANSASWQWVAGTFSDKRYIANQDNLNRYAGTDQHGTWLDVSYDELLTLELPEALHERQAPELESALPGIRLDELTLTHGAPLALHSIWNLDPRWRRDIDQRIVFVDADLTTRWPMAAQRWQFIAHWAERCGATLVHGSVAALHDRIAEIDVVCIEYPACDSWPGTVEPRNWLYPMPDEAFPSFSKYWKQVKGSVGV